MKLPDFANAPFVEIGPGEHFVGQSRTVIKTLLGSCIAVCLFDAKTGIYGMNHFLLPTDKLKRSSLLDSRTGYYGLHAMDLVINGMIKLGADKRRITSKVFGGGNVVPQLVNRSGDFETVGDQNIAFTYEFLKRNRIAIVNEDVGGKHGRVIYFDSRDFSVYLTLIDHQQESLIQKKEILYYNNSKKQASRLKPKITAWN